MTTRCAVGRLSRDIIEDITLNEDYCQKPLDIERNLPVLTGLSGANTRPASYTDYTASLGVTRGNDKLIEPASGSLAATTS